MIGERRLAVQQAHKAENPRIGTLGHLAVFGWSLGVVIFAPPGRIVIAAGLSLLAALLLHPAAVRRAFRPRWILLLGSAVIMNLFWTGEASHRLLGLPISMAGLEAGFQMALRAFVILAAVDSFSSSVSISEVAGLLERMGLPGLGFSLGVAFNLLPGLRQSSLHAWRSLRMRGGFRRRRWRALQLFMVTVMANALRWGDEVSVAAEARAYSPERSRALPLKTGRLDGTIALIALASGLFILLF